MVSRAGIEPARPYGHKILSLAWLPITPPGQEAIISHIPHKNNLSALVFNS